jgi:uncharacterized protein YqgV (UPF0045/DUF77 family)
VLKVDERRDREQSLQDKVDSVSDRLRAQPEGAYPPGD